MMFCPKCQSPVPDNAPFCPKCGAQVANNFAAQQPVRIKTYMTEAILATLFCCLPFGIASIVCASKANGCLNVQDYAGAQKNADNAKKWFWVAFILGLVANILMVLVNIAAA